ncbi:MAG: ABC transporter [Candidatus Chloroheliales bacterium]|nr:MAG: ABC transporter [Chloroflexota bacterium]
MITFDDVTYTYPESSSAALRDVSLQIGAGEFVLLVGGSGAGKSTLLRAMNGLVPHFYGGVWRGHVLLDGVDTLTRQPHELAGQVGFVFQDPEAQAVAEEVENELAFGMENLGLDPLLMRRRVEEVLHQLDLDHLRKRRISTLSGGERQRLAIAAALTMQPRALLLDEPTSQLDPQSAEELLTLLQKLNADLGITVVISEHRLERVVQYADRILYMADGAIAADDLPRAALAAIPFTPPVATLGKALGWAPLPLSVREARRFAAAGPLPASPTVGGVSATPSLISGGGQGGGAGDPLLELRNLSFAYAGVEVLRNVNLVVQRGEVLAVMGRNGAGKTTLLKLIVGLLQPSGGTVRLASERVSGRPVSELARCIGYVPQNARVTLFADTVSDELRFTLRGHHLPVDEQRVNDTLAALGIAQHAARYPRDLSIGEQQRVGIAALLVANPDVVLLDEPTRGLDYANKAALVAYLDTLKRQGRAVVLVTHDVELVAEVADRVALLANGEVAVSGPTRTVLGGSLIFSTQVGKLYGNGMLTAKDVMRSEE